jgi:hypothetical protein
MIDGMRLGVGMGQTRAAPFEDEDDDEVRATPAPSS